jgi:hypothetical protein
MAPPTRLTDEQVAALAKHGAEQFGDGLFDRATCATVQALAHEVLATRQRRCGNCVHGRGEDDIPSYCALWGIRGISPVHFCADFHPKEGQ